MKGFTKIKNKLIISSLKDSDYRVLTYLIARSKNGECFPSIRTMANDLPSSKETIRKSIDNLIKDNYIKKESRIIGTGKKTSNLYTINEEYLTTKPKQEVEEVSQEKLELLDYNWLEEEE